ncbi:MAG: helix-turn-helix domain-containing protein [Niabella sp.]
MYQHYDPPSHLRHIVCFFYAMEHHEDDGPLQTLLPSGTPVNGWQYAGRWRLKMNLAIPANDWLLPDFYFVGQQTVSYSLTAEGGLAGIFGAALQPGMLYKLLGKPTHLLTNNAVDTSALFPAPFIRPYITRYKALQNNDDRYHLLVNFYEQFSIPETHEMYKEAIRLIYRHKGCISIRQLCEKLNINERYLQREFRTHIGIPPSAYLNIIRFNNIFTELSLSKEKQNLETLAMLFNYYDLSHFNKEHKRYFSMAPSHFLIEEFKLLNELVSKDPYLLQVQLQNLK